MLIIFLMCITTIINFSFASVTKAESDEKAGWYFTSYELRISNTQIKGTTASKWVANGTDTLSCLEVTDSDGNQYSGVADLKNDVTINEYILSASKNGWDYWHGVKYNVEWEDPASYMEPGKKFNIYGVSSKAIGGKGIYSDTKVYAPSIRFRLEYNQYMKNKHSDKLSFVTSDSKEDIEDGYSGGLISKEVIPQGIAGETADIVIELNTADVKKGQSVYAVYTYTYLKPDKEPVPVKPDKKPVSIKKAGWYLTNSELRVGTEQYKWNTGSTDALTCIEVNDFDGNEYHGVTNLKNDIIIHNYTLTKSDTDWDYWRGVKYNVEWSKPASYIEPDKKFKIYGFRAKAIGGTSDETNTPPIFFAFKYKNTKNQYDYKIYFVLNDERKPFLLDGRYSGDLISSEVIPQGIAGNKADIEIQLNNSSAEKGQTVYAVYTYTYLEPDKKNVSKPTKKSVFSIKYGYCNSKANRVYLGWTKCKGADGYRIYRAKVNGKGKIGKYKLVTNKKLSAGTFKYIDKVSKGNYLYKLVAVNNYGNKIKSVKKYVDVKKSR